jgi:hypothetical protein
MSVQCFVCENDWDLEFIKIDNNHSYCIMCYENIFNDYKLKKPYKGTANEDPVATLTNMFGCVVDNMKGLQYQNEVLKNFIRKINK